MSKRLEELKKGCGKEMTKTQSGWTICGKKGISSWNEKRFCFICQARIDEREKMEKEVKDGIKRFHDKLIEKHPKEVREFCEKDYSNTIYPKILKELGLSEDTKQ